MVMLHVITENYTMISGILGGCVHDHVITMDVNIDQ
jgi:hypothetical protein